jgi:predicted RNA-binding protein YlxR (DUF448 family)
MPDGSVMLDASGKVPGRGAYLCADGSCWSTALKKRSIERALDVSLPADVVARLESGRVDTPGGIARGA